MSVSLTNNQLIFEAYLSTATELHRLVNKLQQTCQFHQVATSLLKQACCNLSFADLLQLVEKTCGKPVDNKF